MTLRGAGVVVVVVLIDVLVEIDDVDVDVELEDDEPMLELVESAARSVLAFPIPDAA